MSTEPDRPPRQKLKPPPNYNSRKVQVKLFILVAACMGVLWLVTEAAKPERWGWFFGRPPVAEQRAEVAEPEIDTKLHLPPTALDEGVVKILDPFQGSLDDVAHLEGLDPVSRAVADGWAAFYEQANRDEHDLIAKGLKAASETKPLDEQDGDTWSELLAKIDRFWSGYRDNALKALQEPAAADDAKPLSEEDQAKWTEVLEKVGAAWDRDRAVLAKLGQRGEISFTDAEREDLRLWQLRWERMSLAAIKDDTVHRPAEGDAWFRLLDLLNTTPQEALDRQPAIDVGFVQLFKQSNEYRGKLVRIHGRIMQAKRIKATRNVYGIQHQYLLWIKPEGGPKSPLVVYALEMPPGFPSLDYPTLTGDYTKLREDVVVTGYYFKRWAYPSQQGTMTAPLILAKSPHWIPGPDLAARNPELPSRWTFLSWVLGSALFAIAVAVVAYRMSMRRSPAMETFESSPSAQRELRDSLSSAHAGPGPLDTLRELEQRDRHSEGNKP
jgi:hypothetical protein